MASKYVITIGTAILYPDPNQMHTIKSLTDSLFMKRLNRSSDDHVLDLASNVRAITKPAADLLSTVVKDMPLYTLHNERHILNVIGWMESLLTAKSINELSPLECALCILAAYAHDLGMTLSEAERVGLPEDPEYMRFRDRFLEERQLIQCLRNDGQHDRAYVIENHLRTEYLRTTHADQRAERLRQRLQEIARGRQFVYKGVDYRRQLELVAISHNQPVEWLRLQLENEGLRWRETLGHNEAVNFVLVGILLRLADIMDFDASRTPTILFRHLGLDRELATRFEKISSQEWMKHLAITGIEWSASNNVLTYLAASCPHPVIEKSIREFVGMIHSEVSQAAAEMLHIQDGRSPIYLPKSVKADITPMWKNGGPAYTYRDWHFRLDQEEIIRLLMGESLYGDPALCIRELLQNALDAVELRDLRLQLRTKGGQPNQPVDGEQLPGKPGWLICDGKEEELAVSLTWGQENGQQFIRIEDNGTGMTQETIERYFTQIGKSFYRSPDFRSEQAEMRRHGLIATPISMFGIGILSSFMIADRITVRTHPGAVNASRPALDLEISGPGSLFWTLPGTRTRQGTEVTLWLHSELQGKPVRLAHHKMTSFRELRGFFFYPDNTPAHKDQDAGLDPGLIAAQHVVWPKYPVHVRPPDSERWSIDDRFHVDKLAPLTCEQFAAKLDEWEYASEAAGNLRWELIDWVDGQGEKATGTRVRLWRPVDHEAKKPLQSWELEAFAGAQVGARPSVVVIQSMRVDNLAAIWEVLPLQPGNGWRVWIDLRGAAIPKLTVSRRTALLPDDESGWRGLISDMFKRFIKHLLKSTNLSAVLGNGWKKEWASILKSALPLPFRELDLVKDSGTEPRWRLMAAAFVTGITLGTFPNQIDPRLLARERDLDLTLTIGFYLTSYRALERDRARDQDRTIALDLARAHAQSLSSRSLELAHGTGNLDLLVSHELARDLDLRRDGVLARKSHDSLHNNLEVLQTSWLQEAFRPDLRHSWPALELQALDGKIGDAILVAPAKFRFELDGHRVLFGDQQGAEPAELARRKYDLCFPMTTIPLCRLRQRFPKWRQDLHFHPIGVIPFLFPELSAALHKHRKHLAWLFPIGEIYALRPELALWYKKFADWTAKDWENRNHLSLLWNIREGFVLAARGVHDREEMRHIGRPFQTFRWRTR